MTVAETQGFRLSPQQRRLWRLLDGEPAPAFAARADVRLRGPVDREALSAALDDLVRRHEILRTGFEVLPGMRLPVQVVREGSEARLAEEPAEAETGGEPAAVGSLLRARLSTLGENDHLLRLTLPALCSDAVGLEGLVADLASLYARRADGGADDPGEPEPLQYVDVAEWLNEILESEDAAEGEAFWSRLAPADGTAATGWARAEDLSTLSPRRREVRLPELQASARDLWPLAIAWVRARRGAAADPVGLVADGRRHEELSGSLGLLTRTVPVVLRPDPEATLSAAISGIASQLEELAPWLDFYAGDGDAFLADQIEVRRRLEPIEAAGAEWTLDRREACSEPFHRRWVLEVGENGWSAELLYDGAAVGDAEAELAASRVETALAELARHLAAGRDPRLAEIDVLAPRDRARWIGAAVPTRPSPGWLVPERIAELARREPDAEALVTVRGALSRAEVQRRAEALAAELARRGCGAETVVAVCVERSPELVLAVLGVLASGSTLAPLDPSYPEDRLRWMLADSGASLLVATDELAARLAGSGRSAPQVPTLLVDELGSEQSARPEAAASPIHPQQAAYILYTSGSTGRPKGVVVTHGSLANHLSWVQGRYSLGRDHRALLKTPLSFDVGIRELLWPLVAGCGLAIAGPQEHRDLPALIRRLAEHRVTALNAVPSLLQAMLTEAGIERCDALRWVLSGGEALPWPVVTRATERLPAAQVHNHYGPTEVTITASARIADPAATGDGWAPIGEPIDNARLYLLDRAGRPMPLGVEGELAIGGAGVARGYLARPALTAASFLPDPFSGEPGARLYASGDVCRQDLYGELYFAGRADEQVKVRGFRVELGEIESVLLSHPVVAEAAVAVQAASAGSGGGSASLAAYWVAAGETVSGPAEEAAELRRYLASRLPEHFVPGRFLHVRELPRTPSGKIDRRCLAEVEIAEDAAGGQAPEGTVAELLAAIWCDLLGVEAVAADDDFFALGGHSLLATQVIARLRVVFGVELPVRTVFEVPTLEELAGRVDRLLAGGREPLPPLEPMERPPEGPPLSFAQTRLWVLHELEPGSAAYNIPGAVELVGDLRLEALAAAFDEVARRHESLRTTLAVSSGEPVQTVHPPAAPRRLPVADLTALSSADRARQVEELTAADAARPFDLTGSPPWRVTVLRLSDRKSRVLVNLHHLIADGWSVGILVREIVAFYTAALGDRRSPLPEPAVQYADYALWQRQALDEERIAADLAYWRERLGEEDRLLELPTDRPRPAVWSHRGALERWSFDADLAAAAEALGRRSSATLFMVLLAAFQVLLFRYTGQRHLRVGSPTAGRDRVELEGLIGLFVNTLVLAGDLEPGLGFQKLLEQVRETSLGAHSHQQLPFERLVDKLRPDRDLGRSPLFQVVLVLQNAPRSEFALPGVDLRSVAVDSRTAKFDLTLVASREPEGVRGNLEYSTDLFDRTTVLRLVQHLETLLQAAVAAPETPLAELPLLTVAERHQTVHGWNDGAAVEARAGSAETTIWELFAAQAAARPDAVALSSDDGWRSYGDLRRGAVRLAVRLRQRGAGPGSRVAVQLPPSAAMVEATLAVLAAGACYVPVDPGYPESRRRFLLEDSGATLAIVAGEPTEGLPAGCTAIDVESRDAGGERSSEEEPATWGVADPLAPAYVIYTSGSTGQPKGVVVSNRNVTRLLAATDPWFGFGSEDVWTLFHSFSFDFSVWELWGALCYGGRLVVVPRAERLSAESFYRRLCDERATVLNQTPSAFRQLIQVERLRGGALPLALRWVVFGGEALEFESLRSWFAEHGDRRPRLVNMYGITETTVHVSYREVDRQDLETARGSSIGVPIPDLQLYVADPAGRPLPIGVAGELLVGGAGLASGYLGRPALTAERFVPDALSREPGARLYRSGDLGRLGPDGRVEYLGRIDDQVKIRGFRIELGEIEAALVRHPAMSVVTVTAREAEPGSRRDADGSGDRRLVAYLVCAESPGPAVDELRRFLAASLPEHMVPAAFVELDALPLTAHGKVDRRALPEPEMARPSLESRFRPPSNETEEVLTAIWERTLGRHPIGVDDNFFALGGDSILSLRVVAEARELGLGLSLAQLFQYQTVADLAADLGAAAGDDLPETRPFGLLTEEDRRRLPPGLEDAYPLATLQAGMLHHMFADLGEVPYHNVDSWQLRMPFSASALRTAVAAAVERHPVLRTSFDLTSYDEPLQLVHRRAPLPLTLVDLRDVDPDEQERIIDRVVYDEKRNLFPLDAVPQVRFLVHRRSESTLQLTFTENHAIFDGWSVHSTLGEIFRHYFALLEGEEPESESPIDLTYRDFVALERRALDTPDALEFWRQRLAGCDFPALPPRAGEPPAGPRYRVVPYEIPDADYEALNALSRRLAVPVKSLLLAVHLRVLAEVYGQPDAISGVVTNGRPETAGGERLRGLFLNMVPLRLEIGNQSWEELARQVFAEERAILPHRRYPYAELQRRLGSGVIDVVFNYIHFHVITDLLESGRIEALDFRKAEGSNFKLHVVFAQLLTGSGLKLTVEHDTRSVDGAWVRDLVDAYRRALDAMVADPGASVAAVPLHSRAASHRLLVEWNATAAPLDPRSLPERFAAMVAERPDAVAAVHGDRCVSYEELGRRTRRFAAALAAAGIEPESVVALLMPRGIDFLISMLAAFEAGAAYLPLDLEHPPARSAFALEESGARVVIGRGADRERVGEVAELAGLVPERRLWAERMHGAEEPPPGSALRPRHPASLAYVIYTSGSTGRPKGAMVADEGKLNHLDAKLEDLALDASDVTAQTASHCFDISVWQYLAPLVSGGRVEIFGNEVARDPGRLLRELDRRRVTVFETVPSLLSIFLEEGSSADGVLGALRWMISTGEALPPGLAEDWSARHPSVPALNAYGPTECSDDVTHHRVAQHFDAGETRVPVGRPVHNTQIYVLDAAHRPVAVGTDGEVWVGGVGVGRGYLADPRRTAETFRPDPLSTAPGGRLYRTGDRGRFRPSGALDYLGRDDAQVKIRGLRVELGEIKAVLGAHPAVAQAVVLARGEETAGQTLVGWYVAEPGATVDDRELFAELRRQLPPHMVPAVLMQLDAMPLTDGGKLDRRSLPDPPAEEAHSRPLDPVEELVAGVWSEVLGVEPSSAEDDFFHLGGHSLSATQVVSRLRRQLGVELPLLVVFEQPTVRGLASAVSRQLGAGEIAAIEPVPRYGELPLSHAQQRLWILEQLDPGTAAYNLAEAVELRGELSPPALTAAFDALIRRHESLRTVFPERRGEASQRILPPSEWRLPVIDLSALAELVREEAARRLAVEDRRRPFDLAAGPLVRAALVRRTAREHVLLFVVHHIVSDFWSLAVLVRELSALYSAVLAGGPARLPELPVQYADFAVWQRRWMGSPELEPQLEYWRRQLGSPPPRLDLGREPDADDRQRWRGAQHPVHLPAALVDELRALAREEGATLFMILLAGLKILLYRSTGQADLVVGTDIANRNRVETEGLIGFFVNLLALRSDLSGVPSGREVVRRVRETALGAYAHQDLPFDYLVRTLRPERSLSHSPLFDLLFVLQNAPEEPLELPGLTTGRFPVPHDISRFELSLFLREGDGEIRGSWVFKPEIYSPGLIGRLSQELVAIWSSLVQQPDVSIERLSLTDDLQEAAMESLGTKNKKKSFRDIAGRRKRPVQEPQAELVRSGPLDPEQPFPWLYEPNAADVDLAEWAAAHRAELDEKLLEHGALLFRGFRLPEIQDFERFAVAVTDQLYGDYGDLPRESQGASDMIYESTPYPSDKTILFHNESSHMHSWPRKQFFHCVLAARERGETPIVDCREIYRSLDSAVVAKLDEYGLMYVRNFTPGFDVNWQEFFKTDDRSKVEEFCAEADIQCEWKDDGGLRTRKVGPATIAHPLTGEKVFFNQLQLHHVHCLDPEVRESLLALFPFEDLPRNVYYGDGSTLEDEVVAAVLDTYWQESVAFPWQEGDTLMVDNMLVAHARNPFVGPRKLVVAMGDMVSRDDLAATRP